MNPLSTAHRVKTPSHHGRDARVQTSREPQRHQNTGETPVPLAATSFTGRALGKLLLVGLISGAVIGCNTVDEAGAVQPVTILEQMGGEDPGLTEMGIRLVNSPEQLQAIGSQTLARQDIDFTQQSLIIFALGRQPTSGYWAKITGVQTNGPDLYVQALANAPAPDEMTIQSESSVYHAVLVKKLGPQIVHPEIDSVQGQPLGAD